MAMDERKVVVLGDSRTFDTYYYNSYYDECYGYDQTFHFILRRRMLLNADRRLEVIHIPDHFRGHSVENNILRLALTDPALVILCDGIWETLVNKEMFIDYATEKIRSHETFGGGTLELRYDSRVLADLFVENRLSNSPANFLEKHRRLVSYFRRRQRPSILMKLVVPDLSHLNRVHFAGNYRCIPEWDLCLGTLNKGLDVLGEKYGVPILDTHELVMKNGGFGKNLIDQWHFSSSFHTVLADHLEGILSENLHGFGLPPDHISHRYMLHKDLGAESVLIYGTGTFSRDWLRSHPKAKVEAVVDIKPEKQFFHSIPVTGVSDLAERKSKLILLALPEAEREEAEICLIRRLPADKIILYPEELDPSVYKSLKGL